MKLYSVKDAAAKLKVERTTVWRWAKKLGVGLAVGRTTVFTPADVEKIRKAMG